jgi:hypothetical protein
VGMKLNGTHQLLVCVDVYNKKNTILPVVLYWYETWYPTLKEEHGLRVLENRVKKKKIKLSLCLTN